MNVCVVSLKGKRDANEDKHIVLFNGDGKYDKLPPVNLFAIFDGHGGGDVSKFLSRTVPIYLINKKLNYPLNTKYVYAVYDHLQDVLKKKYSSIAKNMGSTNLAVVHFKKNRESYLNIINLGDCRCVLCRDNLANALTKDHKPYWPEEKNRIEKLGGTIYFDGEDWRIKDLSVSRAMGDTSATPYVSHVPDIFRYKLNKTDKFIILACDGLWDVVTNQEAVNFVLNNCYDETTNERINKNINIAKKLGEYAIGKGSNDNVTVIVVFLR